MPLELQNISGGYGNEIILENINFSIQNGEIISILGPNGSGKSTLLKIAGRLRKPFSGEVFLNGRMIRNIPSGEIAKQIAILPQKSEIPEIMTVEELVSLGRYPYRESASETRKHVDQALESMEISGFRQRQVSTLSGGELQRARLAMTLAQDPQFLLLDEPTTFLDVRCQFEILELIRKLNRERQISVLMILHDLSLASVYSDRILFLKEKKIFYSGTPEQTMKPEIIRDVFGIQTEIIRSDGKIYCLSTGKDTSGN